MRFAADSHPEGYLIRSYGSGSLRIGQSVHETAIILSATTLLPIPQIQRACELTMGELDAMLATSPQVVLIGSPHADDWPGPQWRAAMLQRNVGVEVMNTGAACRTYNVLMSERRLVTAVLIP